MPQLPPGFVLDEDPPRAAGGLPPGFVLDSADAPAPVATGSVATATTSVAGPPAQPPPRPTAEDLLMPGHGAAAPRPTPPPSTFGPLPTDRPSRVAPADPETGRTQAPGPTVPSPFAGTLQRFNDPAVQDQVQQAIGQNPALALQFLGNLGGGTLEGLTSPESLKYVAPVAASAALAPVLGPAAPLVPAAISAFFAHDMANAAAEQIPEVMYARTPEERAAAAGQLAGTGLMLAGPLAHAGKGAVDFARGKGAPPRPTLVEQLKPSGGPTDWTFAPEAPEQARPAAPPAGDPAAVAYAEKLRERQRQKDLDRIRADSKARKQGTKAPPQQFRPDPFDVDLANAEADRRFGPMARPQQAPPPAPPPQAPPAAPFVARTKQLAPPTWAEPVEPPRPALKPTPAGADPFDDMFQAAMQDRARREGARPLPTPEEAFGPEPAPEPRPGPEPKLDATGGQRQPWEMTRAEHLKEMGVERYKPGEKYHEAGAFGRPLSVDPSRLRAAYGETSRVSDDVAKGMSYDEPIRAGHFQDGSFEIGDGHHRAAAARQSGRPSIRANLNLVNVKGEAVQELLSQSHRLAVQQQLHDGKPVSPEVLADYPDLAAKPQAPTRRTVFHQLRELGAKVGPDVFDKEPEQLTPEEGQYRSFIDPGTRRPNRAAYFVEAKRRPDATHIAIDLDGLKAANDTHGHATGDRYITTFFEEAEKLGLDVARTGGDEAMVITDNPERDIPLIQQLQARMTGMPIQVAGAPEGTYVEHKGFSYGTGRDFEAADSALYADKRNRKAAARDGGAPVQDRPDDGRAPALRDAGAGAGERGPLPQAVEPPAAEASGAPERAGRAVAGGEAHPPREAGAPEGAVASDRIQAATTGHQDIVETSTGTEVPFRYAVVEADHPITSHDTLGNENPAFALPGDESIQNRDRATPDSIAQMARVKGNPNPRLLGAAPTVEHGAPLVRPDRRVIGGNGRMAGLVEAYRQGTAGRYRAGIEAKAKSFGLDAEAIRKMKSPVLIRLMDDEGMQLDQTRLARDTNVGSGLKLSAAEQGRSDAKLMMSPKERDATSRLLSLYEPGSSGDIGSASNRPFIQRFLEKFVPPQEHGALFKGGELTQEGKTRIGGALTAAAYGDSPVVDRLLVGGGDDSRALRTGLVNAAPRLAVVRMRQQLGELEKLDVVKPVLEAADFFNNLRESGRTLESVLNPKYGELVSATEGLSPESLDLVKFVNENARSPRKVTRLLNALADTAEKYETDQGGGLFGGEDAAAFAKEPPPIAQVFKEAMAAAEEEPGAKQGALLLPKGSRGLPKAGEPGISHRAMDSSPERRLKGDEKPVSRQEILSHISKLTGTPIRTGRLGPTTALGLYKPESDVTRMKGWGELEHTAHEVGHAVESKKAAGIIEGAHPEAAGELYQLGKALYGDRKANGGYEREGFAEYIAHTLRGDDMTKVAPAFHSYFTKEVLEKDPAFAKGLQEAVGMFDRWNRQGSVERIRSQIQKTEDSFSARARRVKEGIFNFLGRDKWFDQYAVLDRMKNELASLNGKKPEDVRPTKDPHKMATFLEGNAPGTVQHMLTGAMVDTKGEPIGPSLKEHLGKISDAGKLEDFAVYGIARRAIEREKLGLPTGIKAMVDAHAAVKELETPEFKRALDGLTEWSDGLLNYMEEAGGLSADARAAFRRNNPVYIPFHRWFDPKEHPKPEGGTGRGIVNQASPFKALKGTSHRPFVNPMDALVQYATKVVMVANKVRVARAIAELAESMPGSAAWAEKLPPARVPTNLSVEDIARQLQEAGADLTNADMDATMTIWANAATVKGNEPIVTLFRNGKREYWQLHPDLYRAVTGMDKQVLPALAASLAGKAKRAVQLGATGINATFSLLRNPISDAQDAAIFTKGNGKRFGWNPFAAFGGLVEEWHRTPLVEKTEGLGLKMTGLAGIDAAQAGRLRREALATSKKAKVVTTLEHPVDALRELLSFAEAGPRIQEFKNVLPQAEERWGKGSEDAAVEAGIAYKDVSGNFTRAGSYAKVLNQLIPFFNPTFVGASKIGRTFLLRGGSGADTRRRAFQRGVAFVTVPTLALWMLNRNRQWYQELSPDDKFRHWYFGDDEKVWFRLRKPHGELAGMFSTVPESLADAMWRQSPDKLDDAMIQSLGSFLPPLKPAVVSPLIEAAINRKTFPRVGPIVPEHLVQNRLPEDQYGAYTTETAKKLGKITGTSPMKWEHVIRDTTGGLGLAAIQTAETGVRLATGGSPKRPMGKADIPVVGPGLFQRPGPGVSVNEVYEEEARLQQEKGSGRTVDEARLKSLRKVQQELTAIRKLVDTGQLEPEEGYGRMTRLARAVLQKDEKGSVPKRSPSTSRPEPSWFLQKR